MSKFEIFHKNSNLSHKQVKFRRNTLAFLLFLCVVLCSISITGGVGVSNKNEIAASLLKSSYIESLTNDISQYTTDLCEEAGIPKDIAKKGISYGKIYELERSYIYTALIESEEYNKNAFLANVLHIKDDVKKAVTDSLVANGVTIDTYLETNIDDLATKASNYAKERVRFENEDMYTKILKNAEIINYVIIALSSVAGILIIAKLLTIGNKKYRSLRYAIYSFSGAAVYNLLSCVIFNIYKRMNDDIIHPSYLQDAIDDYISSCTYDFIMTSLFVLFVAVCVAAVCWRMKKHNV